jgi:hypothetical protein
MTAAVERGATALCAAGVAAGVADRGVRGCCALTEIAGIPSPMTNAKITLTRQNRRLVNPSIVHILSPSCWSSLIGVRSS